MGRMEQDVRFSERCPCGAGQVAYVHYSPEYMYGTAYDQTEIWCARCREEYSASSRADGFILTSRVSTGEWSRLRALVEHEHKLLQRDVLEPLGAALDLFVRSRGSNCKQWYPIVAGLLQPKEQSAAELREAIRGYRGLTGWLCAQITVDNVGRLAETLNVQVPLQERLAAWRSAQAAAAAHTIQRVFIPRNSQNA